ncbi:MAG TPA: D-alanyl-D-alanine carboxypeptidase/D-alanyl-D-alanine-endopeptidase [Gemmatimonadaceae bacterium]|nr:D-alanyl-D-alanine carboxypeptidase/D-alanyl-D-alanine-endopeptidase [Gemmatimonadaceae bacterium]
MILSFARARQSTLLLALAIVAAPAAAVAQQPSLRAATVSSEKPAATRPKRRAAKNTKKSARKSAATRKRAPAGPAWTSPRGAEALASDVGAALASHTRSGQWGAIIVSLTRGDTLFEQNADAPMQPASTMKMYTSAIALDHFGPDHTFRTPVLRDGQIGPDGTLTGSLYLKGVGDPSLSPRFWKDEEPMDVLAKQIAAAGVKHVRGDIVGDATAFDDQLVPDGWKTSYLGAAYAARVSALSLDENLVWVVVQPNGKSASVTLDPATTAMPVESSVRVTGGSGGRISASRRPDGSISVRGSIGARSGPLKYSLVVDNPPLFAVGALRASLQKLGIKVDGQTRLGPTPAGAAEVASIASPPLSQIIGEMDRESINLYAELLFRETEHDATKQVGSAANGLAYLRHFLSSKVGTSPSVVDVSDGSGLSQLDHVTPRSMVRLLGFVHHADWGPVFHAALPVEGESGTLRRHGKGAPSRGNLHAKTGTTNTVAALGGYVTARNGEVLAFSLIYNGADRWNAKAAMDQIGATMASFVRE